MGEDLKSFRLRGLDLRFLEYGAGNEGLAHSNPSAQSNEWTFRCLGKKLLARQTGVKKEIVVRAPLSVETPAGFFQFNGHPYREMLHIYADRNGCEVINVVDLEKYLDGLVNAEFNSRWKEDAIEAQVIAARTYAYYTVKEARKNASRRFDLDSTIKDQVYDGSIREDYRASQSVARTRGMILALQKKTGWEPLKAFYHSTCGGRTDLPQDVWGQPFAGFSRSVRCPYCANSPKYQWNFEVGEKEIRDALLTAPHLKSSALGRKGWPQDSARFLTLGRLTSFQVSRADSHGRALELRTVWEIPHARAPSETRSLSFPASVLRGGLGSTRLLSTWFQIRETPSAPGNRRFALYGRGFGHGVGLCQWGAKGMAEQGFTSSQILAHYYPDATLYRIW